MPTEARGTGWDRGLKLLEQCDGSGADALHLSPFILQKCCRESAHLGAKKCIC